MSRRQSCNLVFSQLNGLAADLPAASSLSVPLVWRANEDCQGGVEPRNTQPFSFPGAAYLWDGWNLC